MYTYVNILVGHLKCQGNEVLANAMCKYELLKFGEINYMKHMECIIGIIYIIIVTFKCIKEL